MRSEGFVTSEGIYNTCYNVAGLAFQTPEALMRDGRFRSVRPSVLSRSVHSPVIFLVRIYASLKYMGDSKGTGVIHYIISHHFDHQQ